jgi:hypothetical protein
MYFKEMELEGVNQIHLAEDRNLYHEMLVFLAYLNECQLPKDCFAPWS